MPAEPATLRWNGTAIEPAAPTDAPVLAADSWLVLDGAALAIERHRERFLTAVEAQAGSGARADAIPFWHAALAAIPREGAWFPRVELRGADAAPQLRLLLRPAPPREREAVLATHLGPDPRSTPLVKGPDLAALGAVRRAAAERAAGEGVLCSPESHVVEGGYSALVWWRGDVLHVVHEALPRIRSVTEDALLELAERHGVPVAPSRVAPHELEGAELWVLSALHGPRLAMRWVDGPSLTAQPGRIELWRSRLEALRAPLG